jgi:hypothetical protein
VTGDEFKAWLCRQGKPADRALPAYKYTNPENWVTFKRNREERYVDRVSDMEQADTWLVEWHRWSKAYRPHLGAPRIAPYCRQFVSSDQYDEDASEDRLHKIQMVAVEQSVDALSREHQQAIYTEMRNREVRCQVWRSPTNGRYRDALQAIVVQMRKRFLI